LHYSLAALAGVHALWRSWAFGLSSPSFFPFWSGRDLRFVFHERDAVHEMRAIDNSRRTILERKLALKFEAEGSRRMQELLILAENRIQIEKKRRS